jgi:hypothetical protein
MATNPYRPPAPGTFPIKYEGMADNFHCYRATMSGQKGYVQWAFRAQLQEWMLNNSTGRNFVGNGFGGSKLHPNVPFNNPGDADLFVLFENLVDLMRFEDAFPVLGVTPTLFL